MDTRFALVGGVLVLSIAVTGALIRPPQSSGVAPLGKTVERPTSPIPPKSVAVEESVPESYGANVRSDLFANPESTLPDPAPAAKTLPTNPSSGGDVAPPAPDAIAGYAYTGTVTIDGQMHALLENARTREGDYFQRGDTFLGTRVVQVDADAVTLDVKGQKRRIPKSNAYNVVPLNAQAQAPVDQNAPNPGAAGAAKAAALIYTSDMQNVYQLLQGTPVTSQITFTSGDDSPAATESFTIDIAPGNL